MPRILDRVTDPSSLKRLSLSELETLAAEIREELVQTVTNTGGHLASNLGVVELTIALHRVFDSPRDKLIWDVGHQSYVHKILTDRKELFPSLRQLGGISGFTDKAESVHDHFNSGHASTSISSALGMVAARDLAGEDYNVIAIIGDGSLTGGMAFEAINQAGHLGKRMIVVLNDNGMAISPSVGAISRWSNRLRSDPRYKKAKEKAWHFFSHTPFRKQFYSVGSVFKTKLKGLALPTMFWEELGFYYMGPFEGHSIAELTKALEQARANCKKPTLVHVHTTKGKGYLPAENDCIRFHGVPPNGTSCGTGVSYSDIFAATLLRLMKDNPKIVAITAAMKEGTGLNVVADQFPERFFDVGICEQHAVTFAAGLASQGYIPVVAIYSTFLQRAFDQIVHDVCLQELPVIFAIDRAGIVGEDGKTHQGSFDISYLSLIPGLVVAAPKDENELQHLLYTAVQAKSPMAIRYPRGTVGNGTLDLDLRTIEIGQGELLRYGKDLTIVAAGAMVGPALGAAEHLRRLGLECAVVNARFIKPLDAKLLGEMADATRRIVTVEENTIVGGLGSSVMSFLHASGRHNVHVRCIGLPDAFVEHGSQAALRQKYELDMEGIKKQILAAFPELLLGEGLLGKQSIRS